MTDQPRDWAREGVAAPPAADEALDVADALLPTPLPQSLRAFFTVCDGARCGELEVFNTEGVIEATNAGAHAGQLPADTTVIGTAGSLRSLVMLGDRDEVYEVDDDPWDARTVEIAADSPLDLFRLHRGVPVRSRDRWWALPGAAEAIAEARAGLTRDAAALVEIGIASRVGEPLPPSLEGFASVRPSLAWSSLVTAEALEMTLLNHRPEVPVPGPSAAAQWQHACDAVADSPVREDIRQAAVPDGIVPRDLLSGDGTSMADTIRDFAYLALLARARDHLAALMRRETPRDDATGQRLARVFLAGHVPVSLSSAM